MDVCFNTSSSFPAERVKNKCRIYLNDVPDHIGCLFGAVDCFVDECRWRVCCGGNCTDNWETVLDLRATASQAVSKLFHNALSKKMTIYMDTAMTLTPPKNNISRLQVFEYHPRKC